ncbi:helix-turn-helix domain-containing protein [Flammeovirgaceae bacterium SG7u.111]|nr:helix-turn-helix domain-containing protein [Flammeovirgaceae bacterium SG7u.132]WPO37169.1 helix-turn-helix domain-containing protein [Flammeovirgaceae bacterium SG7u.111]
MEKDRNEKIVAGLERISEVFKTLLWEKAKAHGISPIQIQLLLFVANHKPELCSVSHLAKEFNLTKPTISDAVKMLVKKGFLEKDFSSADSRSYTLFVSQSGKELLDKLDNYYQPLSSELSKLGSEELGNLYSTLTKLIYQLNRSGIIQVQRTCYGCRYYEKKSKASYCHLLQSDLEEEEIRLDCPEFEEKM